jgi:hypothetical protein
MFTPKNNKINTINPNLYILLLSEKSKKLDLELDSTGAEDSISIDIP